jgi:predicted transcriptional regulator
MNAGTDLMRDYQRVTSRIRFLEAHVYEQLSLRAACVALQIRSEVAASLEAHRAASGRRSCSFTLPKAVLAAADRRAKQLDRSRSWVIAEAVRHWAAGTASAASSRAGREARPGYEAEPGLGVQRQAQLRADLALTPEQRVIEAERTARLARPTSVRWRGVLTFDRFEDYLAWKRRERARP